MSSTFGEHRGSQDHDGAEDSMVININTASGLMYLMIKWFCYSFVPTKIHIISKLCYLKTVILIWKRGLQIRKL